MGKTGYFTHRECWRHEMGPGHPECPARLDAIEDRLLVTGVADALERHEAPQASLADIELAHDRMHVAALHAAGAALAATDAVMAGELENAFCAVRPPGHHATRHQAMGFCFFNNVAVGVKYALSRHHLKRVAVIDFDVHHGNGTEDILSGDDRVLMCGIFQHPFYPFSGDQHPAANMVNVPVAAYTKGMDIREIVKMMRIPRLEAFKPELSFISAGFDAHREDDMGQLGMTEQDFTWITSRIKDIARRFSKGRIVSCLEGGYVMGPLARSVEAHVRVLADL